MEPEENLDGNTELKLFVEETLDELERRGIKNASTSNHTSDVITMWELHNVGSETFDVVVVCAAKTFFVHRNVVLRLSPTLVQMAQRINKKVHAIDLRHVPADIVDIFLEYGYNNKEEVLTNASFPKLIRLLITAHELKVKSIAQCLQKTLMSKSRSNIVIHLLDMATETSNNEAINIINDFIILNLKTFTKQQFFAKLHWRHMYSILTRAHLDVRASTEYALKASMQWLHVDEKARKGCIPDITKLIDWRHLSYGCLRKFMAFDPVFRSFFANEACVHLDCAGEPMGKRTYLIKNVWPDWEQLVQLAESWSSPLLGTCQLNGNINSNDRKSHEDFGPVYTVYSHDHLELEFGVEMAQIKVEKQFPHCKIVDLRSETIQYSSFNVVNNKDHEHFSRFCLDKLVPAISISGYSKDGKIIFQTNIIGTNLWSNPLDMTMPFRFQYTTIFCKKQYFVIGGNDRSSTGTRTCFVYSFLDQRPILFSDMNTKRLGSGVAVHYDDIYVIGGLNRAFGNVSYLTSVEKIAVNAQFPKWIEVKPLSHGRAFPGIVIAKNFIYVIGGYTKTCEKFNIRKATWASMTDLPDRFRLSAIHAVLHKKNIVAFRADDTSQMAVINVKANSMTLLNVNGERPDHVIGCTVAFDQLWAIDQFGKFYRYSFITYAWELTDKRCPSQFIQRALTASFVNYSELQGLCEVSRVTRDN